MPSNAGYYHAAYLAAAVIYVAYAGSLLWRARRAENQLRAQGRSG